MEESQFRRWDTYCTVVLHTFICTLWTHRTNVVPVVEEVGEAVEVGKGLVGRGEQGERPFPSKAAAQPGRRHRANQGAEPATAKGRGLEIQYRHGPNNYKDTKP